MRVPYQSCPLCGSEDFQTILEADASRHPLYRKPLPARMVWKGCNDCGHVFIEGPFTSHALSILFADSNESQRPGDHAEQKRLLWARTIEKVSRFQPSGAWLDVGFGDGSAMFTAAEFGYFVRGLDVRSDVVEQMTALGYRAECSQFADYQPTNTAYDIISMFDVLEHCPDPKAELRHARDLLMPGGVLVVSCPNMDCFPWQALDAQGQNPYWGEIEHYHNFTRARLAALLVECGFAVVSFAVSERWRLGMEIVAVRVGEEVPDVDRE